MWRSITKEKKIVSLVAYLTLFFVLMANSLFAGTMGKIAGRVKDSETKEGIVGASVVVKGTNMGTATDFEGDYNINNLPPGRYTLIISSVGYNKVTIENINVRIDLTTRADAELTSTAVSVGEVVIQAKQPLITKDLTSSSAIVSSEEIKLMPVENLHQVINLQAGVVNGHFRGGRSGEVSYLVDGVTVTDAFSGGLSVEVENSSIRQMEVISGTFNAEYGQAMSGIVNIVTKDGGSKYEGSVSGYLGSYFSTHSNIFQNINKFNIGGPKDLQLTLSGPTQILDNLNFFLTARYAKDDGFLYGRRIYNNSDQRAVLIGTAIIDNPTGDSAWVPMSPSEKISFNGKLSYGFSKWKFSYSMFLDDNWSKGYNHAFKWTPDAMKDNYRTNVINSFQVSYLPTQNSFLTFKLSSNVHKYWGHLYADEYDSRFVDPTLGSPATGYTFNQGGNETDRYNRYTITNIGQIAFESQITKEHKVKIGAEFRTHKLFNSWKNIKDQTEGQIDSLGRPIYTIGYTEVGTRFNLAYTREPYEFSAYIQDKMEYDIMIINAGVRFDYFSSRTTMPVDMKNPLNNPLFPGANEVRNAEAEYQISPRLGVSFPISDKGAIHFSYGHFFQIPTFENLYTNHNYLIDQTSSLSSMVGNPELKAQKTVKYELGLQQVVFPNVSLDLSVYYSDIRNLLGTEILKTYEGFNFGRYINQDYGHVKGLIITLDKRYADMFAAKIDYTYQVASGNASDPLQNYYNNQSDPPTEGNKRVVPLNWDQTHTVNMSLTFGDPSDWTTGLIMSYGSGAPYTVSTRYSQGLRFENNGRRPSTLNVDLKANKLFNVFGLDVNTFLLVYNLFDIKNEYGVYASSGRANVDLETQFAAPIIGRNTIEEYVNNPQMYSAPRRISLGFNVNF
ncbi:MAG: Outer membrane receptor protein [Ignavibacteria bacterium]|nr:MAG: Outer membrane receptor protein [Ignavibacteria bacterium]